MMLLVVMNTSLSLIIIRSLSLIISMFQASSLNHSAWVTQSQVLFSTKTIIEN